MLSDIQKGVRELWLSGPDSLWLKQQGCCFGHYNFTQFFIIVTPFSVNTDSG